MPFKFALLLSAISIMVFFIIFPSLAVSSSYGYLSLWAKNIVPSVLPFIICINILLSLNTPSHKRKPADFFCIALFGLPSDVLYTSLISIVSGYPMGAKTASSLYQKGRINSDELQRLLSFVNVPSPVFSVCALGVSLLGSASYGRLIFISCLLSSLTNALFFRLYSTPKPCFATPLTSKPTSMDIMADSLTSVLKIGAYIMFFGIISDILSFIPMLKILSYFTEITSASAKISTLVLTIRQKCTLLAFMLSSGGICMQIQIFSFLKDLPVNKTVYFASQFIKSALSASLCFFLFPLAETAPTSTAYTTFAHSFYNNLNIPIFFITIPVAILLLLLGIKKRQV